MAKIKEYEAAIEQAKIDQKKIDYEERRKTIQVRFLDRYHDQGCIVVIALPIYEIHVELWTCHVLARLIGLG